MRSNIKQYKYKGKIYLHTNNGWITRIGEIVPDLIQGELNDAFSHEIFGAINSFNDLRQSIEELSGNEQYYSAIRLIDNNSNLASDEWEYSYLLTKQMSLSRKVNNPNKTVSIYNSNADVLSENFYALTSLIAAYLDLRLFQEANTIYSRACELSIEQHGYITHELQSTGFRLKKLTE